MSLASMHGKVGRKSASVQNAKAAVVSASSQRHHTKPSVDSDVEVVGETFVPQEHLRELLGYNTTPATDAELKACKVVQVSLPNDA
jgi:hypothetical protein